MENYDDFLQSKTKHFKDTGFEIAEDNLNTFLFPFTEFASTIKTGPSKNKGGLLVKGPGPSIA